MSSSGDVPVTGNERLHLLAQDDLPALALGETVPAEIGEHVRACSLCSADLRALASVVDAARGTDASEVPAFTPARQDAVWARIAADVGSGEPSRSSEPAESPGSPASPGSSVPGVTTLDDAREGRRAYTRRGPLGRVVQRWTLVAAALVLVAGIGGWFLGHETRSTSVASSSARAALTAQPGTTATARGTAVMTASSHGYQMQLSTSGLPAPDGYYEVWLYDPSANRMVAIGTLGTGAQGSFTLPAGIDTSVYRIVDVSDQRFNGDPRHQTSVLRGALTP